jgi:hypothetical protein
MQPDYIDIEHCLFLLFELVYLIVTNSCRDECVDLAPVCSSLFFFHKSFLPIPTPASRTSSPYFSSVHQPFLDFSYDRNVVRASLPKCPYCVPAHSD